MHYDEIELCPMCEGELEDGICHFCADVDDTAECRRCHRVVPIEELMQGLLEGLCERCSEAALRAYYGDTSVPPWSTFVSAVGGAPYLT